MIRLYLIKYSSGVRLVLREVHIQLQDEAASVGRGSRGRGGGAAVGRREMFIQDSIDGNQ